SAVVRRERCLLSRGANSLKRPASFTWEISQAVPVPWMRRRCGRVRIDPGHLALAVQMNQVDLPKDLPRSPADGLEVCGTAPGHRPYIWRRHTRAIQAAICSRA